MRIGPGALPEQHRCSFRDAQQQHRAIPVPKTGGSTIISQHTAHLILLLTTTISWVFVAQPMGAVPRHRAPPRAAGSGEEEKEWGKKKKLKHIKGVNKRLI